MMIKGAPIAQKIYKNLKPKISFLKTKNIIPTLAIIFVGNDFPSKIYVNNKKRVGKKLGIKVIINYQPAEIEEKQLLKIIKDYNRNPDIHGIIVQLPLPKNFNEERVIGTVEREKDVDGFVKKSFFENPLGMAVEYVLKAIKPRYLTFKDWLKEKKIAVIGKGRTAGEPIYKRLVKLNNNIVRVTHLTRNPEQIISSSDIVITCVGKKNIITKNNLKRGVILIGVGLHREGDKLKGDYNEKEIKDIASYYTPTPGGIGPVNVACLLKNVVKAAILKKMNPNLPQSVN